MSILKDAGLGENFNEKLFKERISRLMINNSEELRRLALNGEIDRVAELMKTSETYFPSGVVKDAMINGFKKVYPLFFITT